MSFKLEPYCNYIYSVIHSNTCLGTIELSDEEYKFYPTRPVAIDGLDGLDEFISDSLIKLNSGLQ